MSALDLHPQPGEIDARLPIDLAGRSLVGRLVVIVVVAYVAITGVLLGAGWLVLEFGLDSWFGDVDQDVTQWFEANRSGVLTAIASNLSNLSDTFTVVGVAFGAGIVLLVLRCWRQAVVLLVAIPLELAVFLSVGYLVSRPRPDVVPLEAVPGTASFPSGHVAAAIALYGAVAIVARSLSVSARVNRWVLVGAIVIAIGVGISRIYLGLHHPSDIVAGAALGLAALASSVVAARALEAEGR